MNTQLADILEKNRIDALLVSNPINNYYLLGYKTISPEDRDLWSLVTKNHIYSFTHDLNFPLLQEYVTKRGGTPLLMNFKNPLFQHILTIIKKEQIKVLGVEAEDLRVLELDFLQENIKKTNGSLQWKKTQKLILSRRAIKSAEELALLKKAGELADQALFDIAPTIKKGQTELEIASRLTAWFRSRACENSFSPIVAIDQNAAVPHYDSSLNKGTVLPGSLILVDYGVNYKGYCSDTTRVLFYRSITDEQKNIYEKLRKAQEETIRQVRHIKQAKNLDLYCRNVMKKEGIPHDYPHVTGHGVGLQVHELPFIHFRSRDMLQKGQVITIEPGVYIPGKFGMRIEDTLMIDKDSNGVPFTRFPKTISII